ncbi:hypothetical protein [Chryseobacterium pennipullorum]|uniref:Lipoprotein n=1 Tax=Chryseobacterium pennipullorum TaxID=2258963 RepID=A0A3D9AY33_9FLAO|nr:hypothetical protein [Chryseobacterium pennipullorum]REC46248.1 hypothetical protein DRF67_14755 [Chryseobacterium pennipullorum]
MSKKLITVWILMCAGLMLQSCKNYYYFKHTPAVNNEEGNKIHQLKFSNENMEFVTFSDYQFNSINQKYVFFTTKDVSRILKTHMKKPVTEQFLFMYTNMSIYNNLLGFSYEGTSLEDVEKEYGRTPDVDLGNGILYTYDSGTFNVVDIYKKYNGGVVRFINLNSPNEKDPENKKFHLEVKNLFFGLNGGLWDKNAADFQ